MIKIKAIQILTGKFQKSFTLVGPTFNCNCSDLGGDDRGFLIVLPFLGRSNSVAVTFSVLPFLGRSNLGTLLGKVGYSICPIITASFKKGQTSSPQNSGLSSPTRISYLSFYLGLGVQSVIQYMKIIQPGRYGLESQKVQQSRSVAFNSSTLAFEERLCFQQREARKEPCIQICWVNQFSRAFEVTF